MCLQAKSGYWSRCKSCPSLVTFNASCLNYMCTFSTSFCLPCRFFLVLDRLIQASTLQTTCRGWELVSEVISSPLYKLRCILTQAASILPVLPKDCKLLGWGTAPELMLQCCSPWFSAPSCEKYKTMLHTHLTTHSFKYIPSIDLCFRHSTKRFASSLTQC